MHRRLQGDIIFFYCTWYAYTPPTSLSLKPPIRKRIGVTGVVIVIVTFAKIITTVQEIFTAVMKVPFILQLLAALKLRLGRLDQLIRRLLGCRRFLTDWLPQFARQWEANSPTQTMIMAWPDRLGLRGDPDTAVARPIVVLAPSGVRGAWILDLLHHPPDVGPLLLGLSSVSGMRLVVALFNSNVSLNCDSRIVLDHRLGLRLVEIFVLNHHS